MLCFIFKDSQETHSPSIKPDAPKATNGNQYLNNKKISFEPIFIFQSIQNL